MLMLALRLTRGSRLRDKLTKSSPGAISSGCWSLHSFNSNITLLLGDVRYNVVVKNGQTNLMSFLKMSACITLGRELLIEDENESVINSSF